MDRVKASVWEPGKVHEMEGVWAVLDYKSALALVQMSVSMVETKVSKLVAWMAALKVAKMVAR